MTSPDKRLPIGAASGLTYWLAVQLIGRLMMLADNAGEFLLLAFNGLNTLLGGWLAAPYIAITGYHDSHSFYGYVDSVVFLIIALLPAIVTGMLISRVLHASSLKKLFWNCCVIQLALNVIVGIPVMLLALSQIG